ncbi:tetratricopeptide repeat protein [Hymenobacter lutimineralis]|uniref:Tetratricopeptide repeat protein n=1 Tax=Hymenobacter lutimineralis TaxID=2606448 RepID=A0A5D6UZF4_9BACT|nr:MULTISPECIES: tetratricopeptide repeat protein [Hymenobacter]QIX59794.1 tetratricopeptide repeat protein [Hymenobacter sp. BT18]TYZ08357.1 tetratricopeptide repeat protein [Hymenobacter lutimineralis]
MKKFLLTIVAACAMQAAMAQNSAVTNAVLYQRQGTLDKARTEIDKAVVNEKTKGKAKTWYTRGEVYEGMAASPIYGKGLQPGEGAKVAFESYQKAIELEGKDSEYGKLAVGKLDNLYGMALNAGVESYNGKKYDEAINSYKMAQQIRPQDTTAFLYAAYASEAKEDFAGAKENYNKLMAINYKSPQMYERLLLIARQEKDEKAALAVVQQALQAYPNNKVFMIEELNMLLSSGQGKQALDKIDRAIAADPTNANLYAVKGSILDQNKQTEQAFAAYKKAVEVDPNNFDAQFNLGVYNFNKGADLYTKVSRMDQAAYMKSGKKMEVDGKKYFEQALPYFEKALQLQPKDQATIKSLSRVYTTLKRNADAERMNKMLDGMK